MMDTDFPRGKTEVPLVASKQLKRKAPPAALSESDNQTGKLADETADSELVKSSKKTKFVNDKLDGVWSNSINTKNIIPNMLALGCINSVMKTELKVELVDGIIVSIPASSISPSIFNNERSKMTSLQGLYSVGQLLVVKIAESNDKNVSTAKKDKKVFKGTIDPKAVNEHLLLTKIQAGQTIVGTIKCVEEKGFLVYLGSPTITGFLPFDKCNLDVDHSDRMIGYTFLCSVEQSADDKIRILKLTLEFTPKINLNVPYRKNQILPGTRVEGSITKVINSGVYIQLKSNSDHINYGFISNSKLPEFFETGKEFEVGSTINCVVTYICPNSHVVGFSARKNLIKKSLFNLEPNSLFNKFEVGQNCKAVCKFVTEKRNGVYFELKNGENDRSVYGFCPVDKLKFREGTINVDRDKYLPGKSRHTLKITGRSLIGQLLYVSDSDSSMKQTIFDVEHAKPGSLVEDVVIKKVEDKGLLVKVCGWINGFVPNVYLDRIGGKLARKYAVGKNITCRVLLADIERNRLILTAKNAQINSVNKSAYFDSYDQRFVGTVQDGVVVMITNSGLGFLVVFYNNVKGFLNLKDDDSHSHSDIHVGQVVVCRIDGINEQEKKLKLSLVDIQGKSSGGDYEKVDKNRESSQNTETELQKLVECDAFNATVIGHTKNGLRVSVDLSNSKKFEGVLPAYHLTDSIVDYDLLAESYKIGDSIGPCVIFSRGCVITVSAKPLIVKAVVEKSSPTAFDQLEESSLVVGVVSKIHQTLGYFIDLPGGQLTGYVPIGQVDGSVNEKSDLDSSLPTTSTDNALIVGQTVVGKVKKVDVEKHRFRLSLRVSECINRRPENSNHDFSQVSIDLLKSYLTEQKKIMNWARSELPADDPRQLLTHDEMTVGRVVPCTINNVTEYGIICTLENGIRGVVVVEHLDKSISDFSENQTVKAAIVRHDFTTCCVELSLLTDLIKNLNKFAFKKDKVPKVLENIKIDQRVKALIVSTKSDSILVSLLDHCEGLLAYLPGRLHYNDATEHKKNNVGDRIHVIIKDKIRSDENCVTVLAQNAENEKNFAIESSKKRKREASESDQLIVHPLKNFVSVKHGKLYDARVLNFYEDDGLYLNIYVNKSQLCRVHLSELTDKFEDGQNLLQNDKYKSGKPIRVKVMEFRHSKHQENVRIAECSAKKSRLTSRNNKRRNLCYKSDFKRNELVPAVVQGFKNDSLEFSINADFKGYVNFLDLSHDLNVLNNLEKHFQKGQIFHARIVAVQSKEKRLRLSLVDSKKRCVQINEPCIGKIAEIHPADGLSLVLSDGNSAFCPITELSDNYDHVPSMIVDMKVGKYVEVMPVCLTTGHKYLATMRKREIESDSECEVKDRLIESVENLKSGDVLRGFVKKMVNKGCVVALGYKVNGRMHLTKAKRDKLFVGMLIEVEVESLESENVTVRLKSDSEVTEIESDDQKVTVNGLENAVENKEGDDSGWESENDDAEKEKSSKNAKKRKMTENELLAKEAQLLNRPTENEEDFDRLLMGSPNNSYLWLRYMALFVQSEEIAKVRLVAERALKTIDLRQENERFNIWTAMLNLENNFGSPESLAQVFERARQVNEPIKVYKQLLKIYQKSGKIKEADQLVEEMLKKFKSDFEAWLNAGEHFFAIEPKRPDQARSLTARAARSLPEDRKIDLASRFAQMEFKYADSERGKTLFENLITQFPKRMDLWSVYADMLTKYKTSEEARIVYERITSLKLPIHKLKSFYHKWQEFENRYGTEESLSLVQQRLETLLTAQQSKKV